MGATPQDDEPDRLTREDIIFYAVMGALFLFAFFAQRWV